MITNAKGQTLHFQLWVTKPKTELMIEFLPNPDTQIKDMIEVEKVLNKMAGPMLKFELKSAWLTRDDVPGIDDVKSEVEAKWDDHEGYVSYAYAATEAAARERMIQLFLPQFEKPDQAREYVKENEDHMLTYKTVTERTHEEG